MITFKFYETQEIAVNKKSCPNKEEIKDFLIRERWYDQKDLKEYDFSNIRTIFMRYYPKTPKELIYELGENGCWLECNESKGAVEMWVIPIKEDIEE